MEKEQLQNRILDLLGNVIISEDVLDKTIIQLKRPQYPQKYAKKLAESTTAETINDALFLKKAREKKYFSICYLTQQLLSEYTTEAVACHILHQYLLQLKCDQEKNLSWYEFNNTKVFTVKPSAKLQNAEAKVLDYLLNEPLKKQHIVRYRHFLTTLFLFFDYITDYGKVAELIAKFSSSELNLRM